MTRIIHWGMTLVASIILIVGFLFIILPGPAIIILPLGIWLFNKYQPGKIQPLIKRFIRFNHKLARRLDRWFAKY